MKMKELHLDFKRDQFIFLQKNQKEEKKFPINEKRWIIKRYFAFANKLAKKQRIIF